MSARNVISVTIGVPLVVSALGGNPSGADFVYGELQDIKLIVADTDDHSPLFISMLSGQGHRTFSVHKPGKIGRHDWFEQIDFAISRHTLR